MSEDVRPAGGAEMFAHSAGGAEMFDAIVISGEQFREGSAYLEEIPIRKIAALSLWLREHPGWKVFIAGHTDSIPISTAEYPSNLELSLARARSVYQLLRMNGISEDRMDYTGCGARMPLAPNDTEAGRLRNRRVEIQAVPPEDYAEGDPDLAAGLDRPDTAAYSLADDAGVCADIVRPAEGRIFHDRSEIDVEIVSPLGSQIELYVDNVPVGAERIGQKRIDVSKGTLEYIFYGVKIEEGANDILVVCREHGGERNTCVRRVYLAGRTRGIVPEHAEVAVPADGRTAPELVFLVNDANGLPVRDGVFADVTGPEDLIGGIDCNPHQTGVQAATGEGRIVIDLPPSRDARREKIRVAIDGISVSCRVDYTSLMRNWLLFGYGEGTLGHGSITGTGSTQRSQERYRDGIYSEGKIAFYGQGEIAEGHLLTAAVDTRPLRDDMLFRRIEPEKYYPIYGDASELRFNAASRSGTFLRLESRRYSAMLGDFQTDTGDNEFTGYHRAFNGVQGESRIGRGSVKAFITRTDQVTYQEEIPAEGTSGFYFLGNYPLVENSEKIRIEVRNRYHPEQIVRVDYKQTGRDYDINYMDGSILFKEPVASVDGNLNPVTIVVSYECRDSGGKNFIYGLRSVVDVTDSLTVGLTAVLEEEGIENASLVGLDLSGEVARGLAVESEYAHSEKFLLGGGDAFRLGIGGSGKGAVAWKTYYREIDHNFFNPSFSGGKTELGSRKFGGELDWRISRAFSLRSEGYRHNLRERDEEKSFAGVMGRYRTGLLDGTIGLAGAAHEDAREGRHSSVLLLTGVSFDRELVSGGIEWDQKLSGEEVQEYPNRIQANLSRKLNRFVSAALKHEYRSGSRTGTRHMTQLGLESNVNENLHLFSRYRLEGAMSGERGQATIGLQNKFRLSPDLSATLGAEKLATVSGSNADDFLAVTGGALYTPPDKDYRVKADYEIRIENVRRKHLTGLAGLKRMSDQWSALLKGDLWFCDERIERNRIKGSSTVGLSLRPRGPGAVALLSLFKVLYEKNSPAHPDGVDREIAASVEANCPLSAGWELEGKVAARWVENTFKAYTAAASTYLY
ncbi:MAG TPA: OmpA family protein, partial [Candidatus Eisenbacteria bacterium]|nr:OmpA family protein [Candidatus Eisenbacteria bacterium]